MNIPEPSCAANSLGTANALLNTFVTSLFAIHCSITSPDLWPADYGESALEYGVDDFDFVVVGAGTAGSVVAGRLAENIHNKVLVIEAGGDPPAETEIPSFRWSLVQSDIDWYFTPQSNRRSCLARNGELCTWIVGKVIGGTNTLNSLAHFRGVPQDYDKWENAGNPSWGWKDVLHYFKKTENYRGENPSGIYGTDGPMSLGSFQVPELYRNLIRDGARELGYTVVNDVNEGPNLRFGQYLGTLDNGRRVYTAKAFLTKKRENLYILKHAEARKIRFDGNLRAKSVSVVYKGAYDLKIRARKEVIISAGTIGTPKLLMLSGIGPKKHLKALGIPVVRDLDVGKNLHEHVRVELFLRMDKPNPTDETTEFMDAFYDQWVHRRGVYGAAIVDFVGFLATHEHSNVPDIQIVANPIGNITTYTEPFKDHIRESILNQVKPQHMVLSLNAFLLNPKSRGSLKLRSTDYRDKPIIYPGYLEEKHDIRTLVDGVKALYDFVGTEAVKNLNGKLLRPDLPECDVYKYRSRKYWACYSRYMSNSCFDYVGTSKMGPKKDPSSVVNSKLQVHGVKRLRVIDASIIPRALSAGPNAATIMIGEKGADFVKARWNL